MAGNSLISLVPASQRLEVVGQFLEALAAREFAAARELLAAAVRFRMLVPSGFMTEANADATIGRLISWFGDADPFEVEALTSSEVEGRAVVVYRLRLRKPDGWRLIEQHLMLDVDTDARISSIDLLCSGFRPIVMQETNRMHHFDAGSLSCADGLAGEFRRQLQQIPIGHTLQVSTSDPAAKEDLPPLARLMGQLVHSVEASGDGRLLVTVERRR